MYHHHLSPSSEKKIKEQRGNVLRIYLLQYCSPGVFRIKADLHLPWLAAHRAVFYIGLSGSSGLIDIQFYGLTAAGANELNGFHLILLTVLTDHVFYFWPY